MIKAVRKNKKLKLIISAELLSGMLLIIGSTFTHASAATKATVGSSLTAGQSVNTAMVSTNATAAGTSTTTTPNSTAAKDTTTSSSPSTATSTVNSTPDIIYPSTLYTNPTGNIALNAEAWAATNPSAAPLMNRLAATPMAEWYVGLNSNVQTDINSYVTAANSAGQVPELVAYNIPERDCGSYSAGGASSAANYNSWMSSFAAGIGMRPAIVILEPDALAGMDCLSNSDQQTRVQLLASAVHILKTETAAHVYIDAGNSNWQSAAVMAQRLDSADIAEADGFSLNVSNFYTTSDSISYGTQLSRLIGNKHFVVDTSRNGNGPDSNDDWCNPAGRALGQTPTLQTGNSLVDAYLWIKGPGGSDGTCGPNEDNTAAPAAGVWWPQDALALMQAAGW